MVKQNGSILGKASTSVRSEKLSRTTANTNGGSAAGAAGGEAAAAGAVGGHGMR